MESRSSIFRTFYTRIHLSLFAVFLDYFFYYSKVSLKNLPFHLCRSVQQFSYNYFSFLPPRLKNSKFIFPTRVLHWTYCLSAILFLWIFWDVPYYLLKSWNTMISPPYFWFPANSILYVLSLILVPVVAFSFGTSGFFFN